MEMFTVFEIVSTCAGIALSVVLFLFPRFGSASHIVALTLILATASTGTLAVGSLRGLQADGVVLAFVFLIFCGVAAWFAAYATERADYVRQLQNHRVFFIIIPLIAPVLVVGLYKLPAQIPVDLNTDGLIPLGPAGYVSAAYLL